MLYKELERGLARNVKSNPKAFWRYCSTKLKNKPRLGDLKTSEGALVQGNKEVDLLNEYFAIVYTHENQPSLESKYDGPPLSKPDITADRVGKKLLKLNVNKAKDSGGLHPRVLKETAAPYLANSVYHPPEVIRQQLLAHELEDRQHQPDISSR